MLLAWELISYTPFESLYCVELEHIRYVQNLFFNTGQNQWKIRLFGCLSCFLDGRAIPTCCSHNSRNIDCLPVRHSIPPALTRLATPTSRQLTYPLGNIFTIPISDGFSLRYGTIVSGSGGFMGVHKRDLMWRVFLDALKTNETS